MDAGNNKRDRLLAALDRAIQNGLPTEIHQPGLARFLGGVHGEIPLESFSRPLKAAIIRVRDKYGLGPGTRETRKRQREELGLVSEHGAVLRQRVSSGADGLPLAPINNSREQAPAPVQEARQASAHAPVHASTLLRDGMGSHRGDHLVVQQPTRVETTTSVLPEYRVELRSTGDESLPDDSLTVSLGMPAFSKSVSRTAEKNSVSHSSPGYSPAEGDLPLPGSSTPATGRCATGTASSESSKVEYLACFPQGVFFVAWVAFVLIVMSLTCEILPTGDLLCLGKVSIPNGTHQHQGALDGNETSYTLVKSSPATMGVELTKCSSLSMCKEKESGFGLSRHFCTWCPTFMLDKDGCTMSCHSFLQVCSIAKDHTITLVRPRCQESEVAHISTHPRELGGRCALDIPLADPIERRGPARVEWTMCSSRPRPREVGVCALCPSFMLDEVGCTSSCLGSRIRFCSLSTEMAFPLFQESSPHLARKGEEPFFSFCWKALFRSMQEALHRLGVDFDWTTFDHWNTLILFFSLLAAFVCPVGLAAMVSACKGFLICINHLVSHMPYSITLWIDLEGEKCWSSSPLLTEL